MKLIFSSWYFNQYLNLSSLKNQFILIELSLSRVLLLIKLSFFICIWGDIWSPMQLSPLMIYTNNTEQYWAHATKWWNFITGSENAYFVVYFMYEHVTILCWFNSKPVCISSFLLHPWHRRGFFIFTSKLYLVKLGKEWFFSLLKFLRKPGSRWPEWFWLNGAW